MIDKYGDAVITRYGLKGVFNVALAKIKVKDPNKLEYIRSFLESKEIYEYLHNSCMASTRASLSEENLKGISIGFLDQSISIDFQNSVNQIRTIIILSQKENRILNSIITNEIPLSVSGQISFK